MSTPAVLFVSNPKEQHCGVYQFGDNVLAALTQHARRYRFVQGHYAEPKTLLDAIENLRPAAVIYNYHPLLMSWVTTDVTRQVHVPQLSIFHECHQEAVDRAKNELFDYHIAPDPTLLPRNPLVFQTGRPLSDYENRFPLPEVPTIGSFGFGLKGKGFERVIEIVQNEYDHAHLRLHITSSPVADPDGTQAARTVEICQSLIHKPGIKLTITHDFLDHGQMLDFLAQNTANVFLYDPYPGRGLSSATDYALAVHRPIALSRSSMFRHLQSVTPSVCIDDRSLREIIASGDGVLDAARQRWSQENMAADYERIIDEALSRPLVPSWKRRHPTFLRFARLIYHQVLHLRARFAPLAEPLPAGASRA